SAVDPADGAAPGELLEPGRRRRPGRGRLTRRDRGTALPIDPHRPHRLGGPGFMGLQSMSYYAALTWVPAIFQDSGMAADRACWMLAFSACPAILTCLITPSIAGRLRPRWIGVAAASVLIGAGFAGLLVAPVSGAYAWMTLLGMGQGAAISLSLSFIVWRSPDAHHT